MNALISAWMGPLWLNVLAPPMFLLASYGAGCGLCRSQRFRRGHGLLVELVLGMNFLAFAALIGSAAALPRWRWCLWIPVSAAAGYGLWCLRRCGCIRWLRRNLPAAILLAAGGAYMLGSALIPPYAWDEQTYQLALPWRWLTTGASGVRLDNPYSAYPALPQFVLLWNVALGGLGAARVLTLCLYLIIDLALYREMRHHLSRASALLLALIFAVSPVVGAMCREVYAEPFIVCNVLAALRLRRFLPSERMRAALGGALAGGVAAMKLSAAGAAAAILIAALPWNGRRRLRHAAVMAAAAVLTAFPFYLRVWLGTGNPVYPFGAKWWGGAGAAAVEQFHYLMGSYYYGIGGVSGLLLSWLWTAFDGRIYDGIVMGWPFAMFVPIGFAGVCRALRKGRGRSGLTAYAAMALCMYAFWALTSQQTRFLLPAYAVLLCLGAASLRRMRERWRRMILVLLCAAALISAGQDFPAVKHFYYCWTMLPAARSFPVYALQHGMREREFLLTVEALFRRVRPQERALLLFERRSLYFPCAAFNGTPGFQEWIFCPLPRTADEAWSELRRHNIDWIFAGASLRNPDHLSAYDQVDAALGRLLLKLLRDGRLRLISVADSGGYVLMRVMKE